MHRKILVMGLPGAGKTALAARLAPRLGAVHFNADEVRRHVNKDLGFSEGDREEQARRMGWLCDQVVKAGGVAIADFVCPTAAARAAFLEGGPALTVFVDRIQECRFDDTNRLFEPPQTFDVRVTATGSPELWAERVAASVRPVFDWRRPTALFVGRYQPFHDGHRALISEGIRRVGQACIAVRDTGGADPKNPFGYEEVRARIEQSMRDLEGRFTVLKLPNITNVFYGRDVGYSIERIELDAPVEAISATSVRALLGAKQS